MSSSGIRRRWRLRDAETAEEPPFEPRNLIGLFASPQWLRDLGQSSWLLVGVALLIVAIIWILTLTETIVAPVIIATVIAAVASPIVRWLTGRGMGRGLATALFMVAAIVLAIGLVVLVVGGITNQ